MTIPAGETGAGTYLVTWNGHGDALALWRIETSGALTLANSFTYTTWGAPTTSTHNGIADLGFRFTYVGEFDVQWDNVHNLGLAYMHARHYSPALGRFLQPDPDASEANLYAYVANRPVSGTDPDGTCFILCLIVVPILLFGGLGAVSGAANYAAATPRDSWSTEGVTDAAINGGVNGALSGTPFPVGRVIGVGGRLMARGAINVAFRAPRVLRYVSPRVGKFVGERAGWVADTLGHGGHKSLGLRLMEPHPTRLGFWTNRQIRWHPGGGHHGPRPYWLPAQANRVYERIYQ
jgi:RHS repeat-associated protein